MGVTATIPAGQSLSDIVDLGPKLRAVGLIMPAAWDAAPITMQVSKDGVNFVDLYDAGGSEFSVSVAASRGVMFVNGTFDVLSLLGFRWLKLRSGPSGAPVNQAAERVITVMASSKG